MLNKLILLLVLIGAITFGVDYVVSKNTEDNARRRVEGWLNAHKMANASRAGRIALERTALVTWLGAGSSSLSADELYSYELMYKAFHDKHDLHTPETWSVGEIEITEDDFIYVNVTIDGKPFRLDVSPSDHIKVGQ